MADYPDPDTWFNNSPAVKARLDVVSLVNKAPMGIGDMTEYIDNNLHEFTRQILNQFRATSLVGGNVMSLGEFAAWADKYLSDLTNSLPGLIRDRPLYKVIRHKQTGVVYAYAAGVFFKVESEDHYHFLRSSGWVPERSLVPDADTNLVEFARAEAIRGGDPSKIQGIEPPPPPKTYTVKAGDTLGKISAATGVSQENLAQWNGITNPDQITEGQVLKLEP